jgi:formylglycine-generating enzyme required for sulfatase activity
MTRRRSALTLLAGATAAVMAIFTVGQTPSQGPLPAVVTIPPGPFQWRPGGDFRSGNAVVDAPLQTIHAESPLTIMRHPVTGADYGACVAARACAPTRGGVDPSLPQTFVSFVDATAYAAWFSDQTGQNWRLPTDQEWVRAAAERWADAPGIVSNADDPAQRWVGAYAENAALRGASDPVLHPIGTFGDNSLGVGDIGGNLWEWTSDCFRRGTVNASDELQLADDPYCGVRIAQGRHRAFVIDFVRDARVGGCAAGLPPDYLGFRLVRD